MIRLTIPDIGKEELKEIKNVLESGFLVQGKKVEEFENIVAKYVGTKYAIAVTSGTTALHLSLVALGIKRGDEVIVPDFTFPATANVVEHVGAKPILTDINLETFNIDVNEIKNKITSKTKAIIPVHLFGQPADMDPIIEIAEENDLYVIEDAACALGAEYKGKKCGNIGDIGCFSFHPRKVITTGEGGMITTNDPDIAEKLRILRNHGIKVINGKYDFVQPGFNYRMNEIQAAMGIVQMRKLDKVIKKRIELARVYDELLEDVSQICVPVVSNYAKHIYQSYVVLVDENISRDLLTSKLREEGIETSIGTYALHAQEFYRNKYQYTANDYPNSQKAYSSGLALPLYSWLSEKNLIIVTTSIRKRLSKWR